jgi:hypothetical protein
VLRPQVENRLFATAYTATTTQPITRYQRLLETAAANEWPREFDPVTGECLGRSVWESRTNLLLRSEEFDNAAYTKAGATISANQVIAPDGTLTADRFIAGAGMTAATITQGTSVTAGTTYTQSVYAKAGTYGYLILLDRGDAVIRAASFDLNTGVVMGVSNATADIKDVGNGQYRCIFTFTRTNTGTASVMCAFANTAHTADRPSNITWAGTESITLWGAQLESGAFATPYTPTVASQVTRLADSAVMTGVNFSSWYRQGEGTLFAEFSYNGTAGASVSVNDNTNQNEISLRTASGANRLFMQTSGVSQAVPLSGTGASPNTFNKYAGSYITNDIAFVFNGASAGVDTSAIIPVVSQLMLGRVGGASPVTLNGYIKRVTYYPQALTAANLQAVTR